jgi:hypothetical protein
MAWQAPKTDWTSADGVRNTDLNRMEENSRVLYLEKLRGNTTLYVSLSGNDTAGTGSSASPFRTISKAVSVLPRDLNGFSAIIHVASSGAFAETVDIKNISNGNIVIGGPANSTVSIMGLNIENSNVQVSNIALTVYSTGIFVGIGGSLVCASGSIAVTAGGVTLRYGATMEVTTTLAISNADRALQVQYGSTASVATLSGAGNNVGIYAYNSTVFVSTLGLTATTRIVNENSVVNTRGVV